jgi:hypothetical protein
MEHDRSEDLPEGVIDADPAGGWESADTADTLTSERDAAATPPVEADGPQVTSAPPAPDGEIGAPDRGAGMPDGDAPAGQSVESADIQQGLDPDLVTDEQADAE